MKMILALTAALALTVGCSSKDKKEDMMKKGEAKMEKAADKMQKMTPEMPAASSVKCSLAKSHRNLDVVKTDKGCELFYTKDGDKKSIASSAHGTTHCEKVAQSMKSKFASAGFSCE